VKSLITFPFIVVKMKIKKIAMSGYTKNASHQ